MVHTSFHRSIFLPAHPHTARMLIIISSILSLIIFTLITAPLCLVSALPNSAPALHRRGPTFYQAQGDSYAAGLGSGIYMTRASRCQQYTESYPNMLNGLINNGENITPENHQACAGATAEDIIKNQRMDPIANVVRPLRSDMRLSMHGG